MRTKRDLLFSIFEQQLQSSLLSEETEDVLVTRVVQHYLTALKTQGFIPPKFLKNIEDDLREEVIEMYRKKTYGHMELASYRKHFAKKTEPKAPKQSESFSKVQFPLLKASKKQKVN